MTRLVLLCFLLTACTPTQNPAPTSAHTDCLPSSTPQGAQVTHIIESDTVDVLTDYRVVSNTVGGWWKTEDESPHQERYNLKIFLIS